MRLLTYNPHSFDVDPALPFVQYIPTPNTASPLQNRPWHLWMPCIFISHLFIPPVSCIVCTTPSSSEPDVFFFFFFHFFFSSFSFSSFLSHHFYSPPSYRTKSSRMCFCGPGLASRQEASMNIYCMCQPPIGRGFFFFFFWKGGVGRLGGKGTEARRVVRKSG